MNITAPSTILILILNAVFAPPIQAHLFENSKESSFAIEYRQLALLLKEVVDQKSALQHKQAIEIQIENLKRNQISGEQAFDTMSDSQKNIFIKKFQSNRFHCGEVTQVMVERQRILLHPELSEVLRDLLEQIP